MHLEAGRWVHHLAGLSSLSPVVLRLVERVCRPRGVDDVEYALAD
jgi:hypothetical protein